MRSGKPTGTASQSRSSRRGGRCSSRFSPLSLSCVLPSFPISYQNKWIVVAPTWRVVRTYQCYPACPPDKSSVSFVVDRTHLCEQVAALRNLFVDSRHAGNSTNLRWIFLAPCLFFCCHAVVPRTRSVSRCLLLDWKEVICATRSCQGYGGNTREFRTQKAEKNGVRCFDTCFTPFVYHILFYYSHHLLQ